MQGKSKFKCTWTVGSDTGQGERGVPGFVQHHSGRIIQRFALGVGDKGFQPDSISRQVFWFGKDHVAPPFLREALLARPAAIIVVEPAGEAIPQPPGEPSRIPPDEGAESVGRHAHGQAYGPVHIAQGRPVGHASDERVVPVAVQVVKGGQAVAGHGELSFGVGFRMPVTLAFCVERNTATVDLQHGIGQHPAQGVVNREAEVCPVVERHHVEELHGEQIGHQAVFHDAGLEVVSRRKAQVHGAVGGEGIAQGVEEGGVGQPGISPADGGRLLVGDLVEIGKSAALTAVQQVLGRRGGAEQTAPQG